MHKLLKISLDAKSDKIFINFSFEMFVVPLHFFRFSKVFSYKKSIPVYIIYTIGTIW